MNGISSYVAKVKQGDFSDKLGTNIMPKIADGMSWTKLYNLYKSSCYAPEYANKLGQSISAKIAKFTSKVQDTYVKVDKGQMRTLINGRWKNGMDFEAYYYGNQSNLARSYKFKLVHKLFDEGNATKWQTHQIKVSLNYVKHQQSKEPMTFIQSLEMFLKTLDIQSFEETPFDPKLILNDNLRTLTSNDLSDDNESDEEDISMKSENNHILPKNNIMNNDRIEERRDYITCIEKDDLNFEPIVRQLLMLMDEEDEVVCLSGVNN